MAIPREHKICTTCGIIEDEVHFLDDCKRFDQLRKIFMMEIKKSFNISIYENSKPSAFMDSDVADIQRLLARFVYDCFIKRSVS